jgi:hypothetical protein
MLDSSPYARQNILIAILFAGLAISCLGYSAYTNDHNWNLIPVLARESTGLANDWFANHTVDSNVHLVPTTLTLWLGHIVPSLDWRLLLMQAMSTALFAWVALFAFARFEIEVPHRVPALAVMFIGASLAQGVGPNFALWEPYFLPRHPAEALLLLAVCLVYSRRFRAAGIAAGVAGILHASVGLAGIVLLGILILLQRPFRWREVVLTLVPAVALCSIAVVPTILAQLEGSGPSPDYVLSIFRFRMPYRFASNWRWQHWLIFGLVNAHILILLRGKLHVPKYRFIATTMAVILSVSIMQWVAVELLGLLAAFKTMLPDRLMPIWRGLYLILLIDSLAAQWTSDKPTAFGRWGAMCSTIWLDAAYLPVLIWDTMTQGGFRIGRAFAWALYPLAAMVGVALASHVLAPMGKFSANMLIGPVALAALATATVIVDRFDAAKNRLRRYIPPGLAMIAILAISVVAAVKTVAPHSAVSRRWALSGDTPMPSDFDRLARWCRDNTSEADGFLTPPDMMSFRLVARRATLVDYKGNGLTDRGIVEWYERLFALYSHGVLPHPREASYESAIDSYYSATAGSIVETAETYGFRYFLTRNSVLTENGVPIGDDAGGVPEYPFVPVRRQGMWTLYDLQSALVSPIGAADAF